MMLGKVRSQSLSLPDFKEAQFYLIDLEEIEDAEVETAIGFLDEESLHRANKRVFREDRHRAILIHAWLRFYLERLINQKASEIKIERDPFGKPYIPGFPIHFNLSHTKRYALLAFDFYHPIGVDIEQIHAIPDFLKIADLFMHPYEKRKLVRSDNSRDYFFSLWCAKEAFLKTVGIGFDELSEWCLDADLSNENQVFSSRNCEIYVYKDRVESHQLAVCQLRLTQNLLVDEVRISTSF